MDDQDKAKKTSLFKRINRRVGKIINALEVGIIVLCVTALAILLIADVFARNFFQSIYFAGEISEFLIILITFVGLSYGVRKARHIRMGAFLDAMHPKVEKIFIIFISFVTALVLFIMAKYSYLYMLNSMDQGHMTPALRLPYWTFYAIMPVGFAMAGIQALRTIAKNLTEKETWMSPEQQSEYEDEVIVKETLMSPEQESEYKDETIAKEVHV